MATTGGATGGGGTGGAASSSLSSWSISKDAACLEGAPPSRAPCGPPARVAFVVHREEPPQVALVPRRRRVDGEGRRLYVHVRRRQLAALGGVLGSLGALGAACSSRRLALSASFSDDTGLCTLPCLACFGTSIRLPLPPGCCLTTCLLTSAEPLPALRAACLAFCFCFLAICAFQIDAVCAVLCVLCGRSDGRNLAKVVWQRVVFSFQRGVPFTLKLLETEMHHPDRAARFRLLDLCVAHC